MAEEKREKKTVSVFDVFLVLLAALVLSLTVYFRLETPYGTGADEKPVYALTMRGTLADWEEDAVPVERQRLLDRDGTPMGRVITVAVVKEGKDKILRLKCEWEGDLPEGMAFRLETADLVKTMRITDISVIAEDGT